MHRIHIVGVNPRTGTTLLAECMRLSYQIERAEDHEAPLRRLRPCSGVYLTKWPGDLAHIGLRLRLDPRFHVLCMMRDPRDTVVSKHGQEPDRYWQHTSLAKFREGWRAIQRYSQHPRFLWIRYEDLIENPDAVQERISARMPFLQATGHFSGFHLQDGISRGSRQALNGVRPIDASNRGKWTNHIERLKEMLEESGPIDDELIALGYETDRHWMAQHGIVLSENAGGGQIARRPRRRYEAVRRAASAVVAGLCARLAIPFG